MAYSRELIERALEAVRHRRAEIDKANEKLKTDLRSRHPELSQLETELARLGTKMVSLAMSGKKETLSELKKEMDAVSQKRAEILSEIEGGLSKYGCDGCQDTGYADGKICDCVKLAARGIMYSELCQEMPIEGSKFDNFDLSYYSDRVGDEGFSPKKLMTTTLKICKEFADAFPSGGNLLFCGGCGLGKTHLSLAIANCVIEKGYSVIYSSAQNLISAVTREMFDHSGSTEKIDSLLDCDLLIIDDLGSEFSTRQSVSVVYNIVNTRLLRSKSTIISTNLELEEIEKTYDARILSRIVGSYKMRKFIGDDIRQLKAVKGLGTK